MRNKIILGVLATVVLGFSACSGSENTESSSTTVLPETTTTETPQKLETTTTTASTVVVTTTAKVVSSVVSRVIDGDTIELNDGTTVRLIGIDTPEKGQCGFEEAKQELSLFVLNEEVVLLPGARDDQDKYGRLLRYVELKGSDINKAMIVSGRAIARYDSRDGYGKHPRETIYLVADELFPNVNICGVPVGTTTPVQNTTGTTQAPVATQPPAEPVVTPAPTSAPVVTNPPAPQPVSYANCTAVRNAGAAPIKVGDPGWDSKFDGDGDGVGCE